MNAPWTDFNGNEIFEGSTIQHPSGEKGIVFSTEDEHPSDKWRVRYEDGTELRLCLQVGDKGQAVVIPPNVTDETRGIET